jgi:hypothetical protein
LANLSCTYEFRDRTGRIVSTGRITLEQLPTLAEAVHLGSHLAYVAEIQHLRPEPHLVLEPN